MLNINRPFLRFITTVGNLIILNFLWGISYIPLITAGASTSTLYYTCVKVIRHDRGSLFSFPVVPFQSETGMCDHDAVTVHQLYGDLPDYSDFLCLSADFSAHGKNSSEIHAL